MGTRPDPQLVAGFRTEQRSAMADLRDRVARLEAMHALTTLVRGFGIRHR